MRMFGIALFLCSVAAPVAAAEYSQRDVDACMGDAFRFCGYAIPSHERVRQCLFANQPSLSTPCFNVIERARAMRATGGQGGQTNQRPRYY